MPKWVTCNKRQKGGGSIKLSTITVEMDSSKKEVYSIVDGETFYKIPVKLGEEDMSIVASQYLLKDIVGRAFITGYLRSDTIKTTGEDAARKERLYTYFMCTGMEEAAEGADDIHDMHVSGRITKCLKFSTLKSGKQILPIVVRCKTDDGHTSIIHVVLTNKNDRYVTSLDDIHDVSITASVVINIRYGTVEVHANDAEIFRKEG